MSSHVETVGPSVRDRQYPEGPAIVRTLPVLVTGNKSCSKSEFWSSDVYLCVPFLSATCYHNETVIMRIKIQQSDKKTLKFNSIGVCLLSFPKMTAHARLNRRLRNSHIHYVRPTVIGCRLPTQRITAELTHRGFCRGNACAVWSLGLPCCDGTHIEIESVFY